MRISDWSSDVCSSDLFLDELGHVVAHVRGHRHPQREELVHVCPGGFLAAVRCDSGGAVDRLGLIVGVRLVLERGEDYLVVTGSDYGRLLPSGDRLEGLDCAHRVEHIAFAEAVDLIDAHHSRPPLVPLRILSHMFCEALPTITPNAPP